MLNKVYSEKYDMTKEEKTLEEEIITTELSDEELDLMYKRYKVLTTEIEEEVGSIDDQVKALIQQFKGGKAFYNGK
jgi:hypothetical protein